MTSAASAPVSLDGRRVARIDGRWRRNKAMDLFDMPQKPTRALTEAGSSRQVAPPTNLTDADVLTLQVTVRLDALLGTASTDERDASTRVWATHVLGQRDWDAVLVATADTSTFVLTHSRAEATGLAGQLAGQEVYLLPIGAWGRTVADHSPNQDAYALTPTATSSTVTGPQLTGGHRVDASSDQQAGGPGEPLGDEQMWGDGQLWADPAQACLAPIVTDMLNRTSPAPSDISPAQDAFSAPLAPTTARPASPVSGPTAGPAAVTAGSGVDPAAIAAIAEGVTTALLKDLKSTDQHSGGTR